MTLTGQCLHPDSILAGGSWLVAPSSFPVSPTCDIVQTLIKAPVVEVFGRHDPVSPGRVHQVIKYCLSLDPET